MAITARRLARAPATLATKNYGFALFQAIEGAKRQLSAQTAAAIKLQLAEFERAMLSVRNFTA